MVNDCSAFTLRVRSEEDRGTEDPLKDPPEPPILRSTLLLAEGVQHLCRTAESNDSALLFDRQRRQEYRHQAVLTPFSAKVLLCGSDNRNRDGRWARKMRFSAAKYSGARIPRIQGKPGGGMPS